MNTEDFLKNLEADLSVKEKQRDLLIAEIKILKRIISKGRGRP